jgi:ribose/xylose/arabinose/galactoside ABC-type transport system permease subunit
LSVGSVLALSTMMSTFLVEKAHWSPFAVIPMVLLIGALFGFCMGYIIHTFELPPFIITLAGLYLARGLCYVISIDTIGITDPFWKGAANIKIPMGNSFISPSVVIALFVVLAGLFVVIGGTLLTGGVGGLLGTVFGVLVYGTIQILIVFQGTLNGWWTRIAIGFLVFVFCLLQSVFESRQGRKQVKISAK